MHWLGAVGTLVAAVVPCKDSQDRADTARCQSNARQAPANLAHAFARAFSETTDKALQGRLAVLRAKLFGTTGEE